VLLLLLFEDEQGKRQHLKKSVERAIPVVCL